MKKRNKKKDGHVNEEVEVATDHDPEVGNAQDYPVDEGQDGAESIPDATVSDADGDNSLTPEEAAIEALEQERDDLKDQLLRARAEFDNYRKRMLREGEQQRKTAAQGLMRGLLPIVDNLERALGHVEDKSDGFTQGIEMIAKQFAEVLSGQGLELIPSIGEAFDPNIHEALTHQPSEQYPADTVMEEFQKGYRLGEFVLRPSQVVVSSGPPVIAASEAVDAERGAETTEQA